MILYKVREHDAVAVQRVAKKGPCLEALWRSWDFNLAWDSYTVRYVWLAMPLCRCRDGTISMKAYSTRSHEPNGMGDFLYHSVLLCNRVHLLPALSEWCLKLWMALRCRTLTTNYFFLCGLILMFRWARSQLSLVIYCSISHCPTATFITDLINTYSYCPNHPNWKDLHFIPAWMVRVECTTRSVGWAEKWQAPEMPESSPRQISAGTPESLQLPRAENRPPTTQHLTAASPFRAVPDLHQTSGNPIKGFFRILNFWIFDPIPPSPHLWEKKNTLFMHYFKQEAVLWRFIHLAFRPNHIHILLTCM